MADAPRDNTNDTPTQRLSDGDWAGIVAPMLLADSTASGRYSSQGGLQTGRSAITDAYNRSSRTTTVSGFTPRPEQPIPDPAQMAGAPKSGKNAQQKPPTTKPVGSTGTQIFGGVVSQIQEYNEDFYWRSAIDVYEQMRRTDAQVAAILTMLYLPIERANWDITPASDDPADIEIASFAKSALFDDLVYVTTEGRTVRQAWQSIIQQVLTMLPFGFSVFAKWWRIDEEGFVKLARLEPVLQRTLWRWWPGADNQLVGVQQRGFRNWQIVYEDIHADALLLFVNRQEGSNYDGWSVLRAAYKHWYYLDVFYRLQGIGIEKHTFMPPIGMLGPLANSQSDADALFEQIKNIRTADSNGLVVPHGSSVEFPKGIQRGQGQEIEFAIHHHDDKIARAVLASFVSMGSNETGTFALADVLVRTFYDTLQGVLEYICGVFNAELIPQLVNYNFRGVQIYPKLTGGSVRRLDMGDITALLPYLNGDPQLEDWLRKLVGAPMAPKSAVNTTNPSGGQPDGNGRRPQGNDLSGGKNGKNDGQGDRNRPQNDNSGDSATDEGADGGADGDSGGGSSLSEVALLTDALASLGLVDAVERAEAHGRVTLSNPYPRGPHGHWGEGGEHGMHQSQVGAKLKGARGKAGGGHNPEHATGPHEGEKVGGGRKAGGGGSKRGGGSRSKGAGEEAGAKRGERAAKATRASSTRAPKAEAKQQPAAESIHERSARLQREGGLKAEAQPGGKNPLLDRMEGAKFSPYSDRVGAGLGAHGLAKMYGEHALGAELHGYSREKLNAEAGHLGIKPGRSNAETISRITAHVTEGRYSANFGAEKAAGKAAKSGAKASSKAKDLPPLETNASRAAFHRDAAREIEERIEQVNSTHYGMPEHQRGEAVERLRALQREYIAQAEKFERADAGSKAGKVAKSGGTRAERAATAKTDVEPFTPIARAAGRLPAHVQVDEPAHLSRALYGDQQLHGVLSQYSHERLREIARGLGVKPSNSRSATAARIAEHVIKSEPYEATLARYGMVPIQNEGAQ